MSDTEHKRKFHRIFYKMPVNLSLDEQQWGCELIDISLHGCLLRLKKPLEAQPPEKLYQLTLHLSEDKTITMHLSVSHTIDKEVGFKCEHIDIDSITDLRRLIELNLGDSKLLERDLLALMH